MNGDDAEELEIYLREGGAMIQYFIEIEYYFIMLERKSHAVSELACIGSESMHKYFMMTQCTIITQVNQLRKQWIHFTVTKFFSLVIWGKNSRICD